MKKLKYLLFILFIIPCMVKADMAGPDLRPYKMVVTDPDGIDYYDNEDETTPKGHLDKDTIFKVYYEYDEVYTIEITEDETGILKTLEGTVLVKDKLDPTKDKDEYVSKLKEENKAIVYSEDGVDILSGPASIYNKVGHIGKNAELKYKYYIGEDEDSISHIYVEYNGKKGWIEILDKQVLIAKKQDFIAMDDYKITGTTIPKNTILRSYYASDVWSGMALIEYNDCTDFVSERDEFSKLLNVDKTNATAKHEFTVYTEYNNKGEKVTTIPKNAKFLRIALYAQRGVDESQMYVEYQNKRGWIKLTSWEEIDEYEEEVENSSLILTDEELEPKKEEKEEEDITPTKKKQKAEDYTLTYVIIGASVALATLVIIILVNKKSKKTKKPKAEKTVSNEEVVANNTPDDNNSEGTSEEKVDDTNLED